MLELFRKNVSPKKVFTDQRFSSLRHNNKIAARCGIEKIIINEYGQRLTQLRPNYLLI